MLLKLGRKRIGPFPEVPEYDALLLEYQNKSLPEYPSRLDYCTFQSRIIPFFPQGILIDTHYFWIVHSLMEEVHISPTVLLHAHFLIAHYIQGPVLNTFLPFTRSVTLVKFLNFLGHDEKMKMITVPTSWSSAWGFDAYLKECAQWAAASITMISIL